MTINTILSVQYLPHEILVIKNFPAVEDEGRLGHVLVDPLVVQRHELVPLGADDHGVGVSGGGVGRGVCGDEGLHPPGALGADGGLGQLAEHLLLGHLNSQSGPEELSTETSKPWGRIWRDGRPHLVSVWRRK